MAANVETFDLDAWLASETCCWPGCSEPALSYVARNHDGLSIGHCPGHHFYIVGNPKVYSVPSPRELDRYRWEGEGGAVVDKTHAT